VAPGVAGGAGTAAWADAGVIVPWTMYEVYGDTRILDRHYVAMTRFIAYMESHSTGLLRPAEGYGDWLSIGADTPKDVLATAYFAYSTALVARIAEVLGKSADAAKYQDLERRIKDAFNKAYVSADGRIRGDTQACYVMALKMDLLPEALRPKAADYLVQDIQRRGNHLSTGFIGTAYLNPVLSANGKTDTAYELLLQDTFPGWLFSIKQGATTIWERWDGWTPEKGFQDPGMNSFNHYSFGAVDQWMYGTIGGIRDDVMHPGYEHFVIAPEPGGGLTHARATYKSIRGEIVSDWKLDDGVFTLEITVPANSTATVTVPTADAAAVTESGKPARNAEGVTFLSASNGRASYRVGSGRYTFRAPAV
jgi:alpha-L-rhamnosidase